MHGGIGRSIQAVEQIEKLERPITMDAGSIVLMDLLWYTKVYVVSLILSFCCFPPTPHHIILCRSDPTENDSIEGLRPNARGPGLVTFGVCSMQLYIIIDSHLIMFMNLFCLLILI